MIPPDHDREQKVRKLKQLKEQWEKLAQEMSEISFGPPPKVYASLERLLGPLKWKPLSEFPNEYGEANGFMIPMNYSRPDAGQEPFQVILRRFFEPEEIMEIKSNQIRTEELVRLMKYSYPEILRKAIRREEDSFFKGTIQHVGNNLGLKLYYSPEQGSPKYFLDRLLSDRNQICQQFTILNQDQVKKIWRLPDITRFCE